jgi:hypothetical protein
MLLSLLVQRILPSSGQDPPKKVPAATIALLPTSQLFYFSVGDPSCVGIRVCSDASAHGKSHLTTIILYNSQVAALLSNTAGAVFFDVSLNLAE